jgi:predicted Zn-dependent protease with MMP-like domain
MKHEDFINVAEEALDPLPEEFHSHIQNVAILVEDLPPNQRPVNLG